MDFYRVLNNTKYEINSFTNMLMEHITDQKNMIESHYRCVSKRMFFLKELFVFDNNAYSDLIIYSLFQMIYNTVIENGCTEKFSLYKRIYIENTFRYLLSIESTRVSASEMAEKLSEDLTIKDYVYHLYGEHGKASGVLHVNKIEYVSTEKYFADIIDTNKYVDNSTLIGNIKEVFNLLDVFINILLRKKRGLIEKTFYNKMEILEYLIGDKKYAAFYAE